MYMHSDFISRKIHRVCALLPHFRKKGLNTISEKGHREGECTVWVVKYTPNRQVNSFLCDVASTDSNVNQMTPANIQQQ